MKLYVVALYGMAAIGGFVFASHWNGSNVASGKNSAKTIKLKNLVREGDIEGTMQAARDLLRDLEAANWNPKALSFERFRVPDQDYHESPMFREAWVPTFFAEIDPTLYSDVAFYSNLYVRKNLRVTPGVEAASHPEGFFIVGFKSGEVRQISLADVRLSAPDAKGGRRFVFPGMASYDPDLRRLAGTY